MYLYQVIIKCLFSNQVCYNFRENDITEVIDHTFTVMQDSFGELQVHELKPDGSTIPVTEDNKKEYVK